MLQLFKVLKIDAKLIFSQLATAHITNTRSRRLPNSTTRGVGDFPYQRYAEWTTLRITNIASFLLKNSIANSPYQWCEESSTPHISDEESHRLPVSLSWRVADSAHHWYVADSPYRWVGVSFFKHEYLQEFEANIRMAQNVVLGTDLCKNLGKSSSFPCPFNFIVQCSGSMTF
jgi:hypothetical protein